jgi:hypothetical protein
LGSSGLGKQFLILFTLLFTFTSDIRGAMFYFCHWYSHQNKWNRPASAKVFAVTPARAEKSECAAFFGCMERLGTMSKGIAGFYESVIWFIHYQIITATIQRASRTSLGAPAMVNRLRLNNCPRAPLHDAILVDREAVSMCPRERRLAGRGGMKEAHPPSEQARTAHALLTVQGSPGELLL